MMNTMTREPPVTVVLPAIIPPTRSRGKRRYLARVLETRIQESLEGLDVEVGFDWVAGNSGSHANDLLIHLEGEDAVAARNFLELNYPVRVQAEDVKPGMKVPRARIVSPGSVGFGVFVDIGMSTGKHALYPLYRMQEQLGCGKTPARKILKMFGFCEGFSVPVVVETVEGEKIGVRLDDAIVDEWNDWVEDGLDRVTCHGDTRSSITRELSSAGERMGHTLVHETGFLDCIITCDGKTDGAGIMALIGPRLPHVKMAVFNPDAIKGARN